MSRHGNHKQLHENDVALVVEFTKRFIYPKCQYINGELQLSKVMAILARKKNLPKEKHDEFNISFRDVVMKTVNQMRNASVQSMRRIYKGKLNMLSQCSLIHTLNANHPFHSSLIHHRSATQTEIQDSQDS